MKHSLTVGAHLDYSQCDDQEYVCVCVDESWVETVSKFPNHFSLGLASKVVLCILFD